ncbi:MAG: glycosyltransferase [Thermodesulfobacteriota bacterium]
MPVVTVIIPTYNRGTVVGRAIQSALNQSFRDLEVIVIDDGSTDCTGHVLRQIQDRRIRIILSNRNRGSGAARNRGLEIARGKYIAFLDSDDEWHADKIEQQVSLMESLGDDWGVCHTGVEVVKANKGKVVIPADSETIGDVFCDYVTGGLSFHTPTLLVRRACFSRIGLFRESLRRMEDSELMMRLLAVYRLTALPDPLARCHHEYRLGISDQVTAACLEIIRIHHGSIQFRHGPNIARQFRSNLHGVAAEANFRDLRLCRGAQYAALACVDHISRRSLRPLRALALGMAMRSPVRRFLTPTIHA